MQIKEALTLKNPCYTKGETIKIKGIMLHSVGAAQPKAEVFIKNFNTSNAKAAVHAFIDGNSGVVYQALPWHFRAWHCGGDANGTHISVEMCEPAYIKYHKNGYDITITDFPKALETVNRTYAAAVELFAYLCDRFSLNPLELGTVISHSEGFKLRLASNHADPEHLWRKINPALTMDKFRKDISKMLLSSGAENDTIYRVQVGAFKSRKNAEAYMKQIKEKGFDAFIVEGKL